MANILLVDDQQAIRSALGRYLTYQGHTVTLAECARTALELFDDETDVVVTDLEMRGMGGSELIDALDVQGSIAPVILMSGRFPHPDEAAGASFVLQKPFAPDKLCEVIERVLPTESRELREA